MLNGQKESCKPLGMILHSRLKTMLLVNVSRAAKMLVEGKKSNCNMVCLSTAKLGDNVLGSVCPSVRLSVCGHSHG